ncbi:MAG TPA: xanthine dehydrogenase family protein subunit M [Dehalococcoidia bacterium]|nr:xanthine dehydrogenase family protein subunit M [Dehalococcoidia bacterium]
MQAIEYQAPQTVREAVGLLQGAGENARVLAGGTDVIVQVREGRRPNVSLLVDVKKIPELTSITFDQQRGLRIGAATPCYRIYENEMVTRLYPALIDSASLIGGTAIQGRASLGGNLCNASPAADTIPTLIVLSGVAEIAGPEGTRELPVEQFCIAPGRTALQPGEMLVGLRFPTPQPRSGARFLRFIPRNEMDIAVVNAAAAVQLDESRNRIASARIAIGAVAPTPLYLEAAGAALAGQEANEASYQRAAEVAITAARPIDDMRGNIGQRKHLVGVMVRRALAGAVERARA